MLTTLRQPGFALLWFGGLISMTGDWILRVALPFHVYHLTGSALSTGMTLIASTLPGVLLGSLAGVCVDRWDRKRTMVMVCAGQGLLLLLLLLAGSAQQLWIIYLVALVESVLAQFFGPAENALLPHLVSKEFLLEANSLNALNNNLAMLIGPALGGALIGRLGLPGVVLLDSASFLIAGVMIWLIRGSFRPVEDRAEAAESASAARMLLAAGKSLWREWLEAVRFVTTDRSVRAVFFAGGLSALGEGVFTVLLVPFVGIFNGGALVLGWLLTIRGLGGLVGGLVVGLSSRFLPARRMFPVSLGLIGLLALLTYNAPALAWTLVMLFLIGVPAMGAQISSQTLFQSSVADRFRGRVFGAFGTTAALLMLSGQGLASALGDQVGIIRMLNIGGGLYLAAGMVALALLRPLPASGAGDQ